MIGEDAGQGRSSSNALAESFFATPKKELAHHEVHETREAARASLFDDIEVFYNRERRHSALGDVSPLAFEQEVASLASIMIRPRQHQLLRSACSCHTVCFRPNSVPNKTRGSPVCLDSCEDQSEPQSSLAGEIE